MLWEFHLQRKNNYNPKIWQNNLEFRNLKKLQSFQPERLTGVGVVVETDRLCENLECVEFVSENLPQKVKSLE